MNNFSIKDIEMLSGIKAHTLRIWEQRHGLCFCKRRQSQHRYYDNEDLKAVLRIAYLYHQGYKISAIAHLSNEEIIQLASQSRENDYDLCIQQLIEANIDYDQPKFEKLIQGAMLRFGFEKSIIRVIYPFMEKIGLLWITEHLIPAQEHFSSALIQQKILVAIERLKPVAPHQDNTLLIFAPEGELHEIPLLIALHQFKKNGIKTVYFGSNISTEQLQYYCGHKSITHFYFHLVTNLLHNDPAEYLHQLGAKFPGVKILASGPGLKNIKTTEAVPVKIVRSIDDLIPAFSSL